MQPEVVDDQKVWCQVAAEDGLEAVVRREDGGEVAKASQANRDREWDDSLSDGFGAMVGAWHAYQGAQEYGSPVAEHELMQAIARYNEVDCRVMMEVISLLRRPH